jgi:hypothetical protein
MAVFCEGHDVAIFHNRSQNNTTFTNSEEIYMSVNLVCGCDASFVAKRISKYQRCPACALRARQLRVERYREKQKVVPVPLTKAIERKVRAVTVVRDPLAVGGFAAGTVFGQDEWEQMLRLMTFTPGTVLMDGQGRLYRFELGK